MAVDQISLATARERISPLAPRHGYSLNAWRDRPTGLWIIADQLYLPALAARSRTVASQMVSSHRTVTVVHGCRTLNRNTYGKMGIGPPWACRRSLLHSVDFGEGRRGATIARLVQRADSVRSSSVPGRT